MVSSTSSSGVILMAGDMSISTISSISVSFVRENVEMHLTLVMSWSSSTVGATKTSMGLALGRRLFLRE